MYMNLGTTIAAVFISATGHSILKDVVSMSGVTTQNQMQVH